MAAANPFNYRILVVDDDAAFGEIAEHVLPAKTFDLRYAEDGFEALNMLKRALPDLILADLNMPRMSGFEFLSVVRRRFPQIPVIAVSGEFAGPDVPHGVIADVFMEKGTYSPRDLVQKIAELLERAPLRASSPKLQYAPVWIPLDERGYYVLTCTNCLRSFPLPQDGNSNGNGTDRKEHEAECDHCGSMVRYYVDVTLREAARSKRA